MKTFLEYLNSNNGAKRILSLDGGGIRGSLTLGYLKRLETILRHKEDTQHLLLCD
jgi:patatin-like phospholipase/acyl hydrolase